MKTIPLIEPSDFKEAVLDILDSADAGDEIYTSYFSIRDDHYGNLFFHHLYQAANRGAEIHLVLDDYGCMHPSDHGSDYKTKPLTYEHLLTLEEIGIRVHLYHVIENTNMFSWSNLCNWEVYSKRNHNKLFVFNLNSIKKRGLITGDSQWVNEHFNQSMKGSNIFIEDLDSYLDAQLYIKKLIKSERTQAPLYGRLDTQKLISLELAYSKTIDFGAHSWSWYKKEKIIKPKMIRFVYSDIEFDNPKDRHTIQDYEVELLKRAEFQVLYSTPYFSPDSQLQNEFIKAKKRVDGNVTLLLGKFRHDDYLPYGVRLTAKRLLKKALNLYEYIGEGNIHYKDMIVDNYTFFKSANGEGRSRFYNLESGVIIKSEKLAKRIRAKIGKDILDSIALDKNTEYLNKHTLTQKIKGLALRPLFFKHL